MKKIVIYFILVSLLFIPFNVKANNYVTNVFEVSFTGDHLIDNQTSEINININVNVSYTLNAILGNLVFDTNKLEFVNCNSNKFSCLYSERLLLDSLDGVKGDKDVATLTFKILDDFNEGDDVYIELINVRGDNNTKGNNAKFKVHKIQTDTSLSNLLIENEELEPAFSKDIYVYNVKTNKSKINIVATSKSSVSNAGIKALNYGNNIFKIVVKAENQEERTYVINAFREINIDKENNVINKNNSVEDSAEKKKNNSNNVNNKEKKLSSNTKLKYLAINGKKIELSNNLYEFDLEFDSNTKEIKVDYETEDKKSKVIISGDTTLKKETGMINISVFAEDGTRVDYKINVLKKDNKSIVSITDGIDEKNEVMKTKNNKKNNLLKIILMIIIPPILIFIFVIKKIIR